MGIKLFAIVLALASLFRVLQRFRRTRRFTLELVTWLVVFSGIGLVTFVPATTDKFAGWLGVSSGFNALTFIAIAWLMLVTFRVLSRIQKAERDITALVRAEAISFAVQVKAREMASPARADGDVVGTG